MKRRQFIALAGAALAFPHLALGQQASLAKRLAFIFTLPEADPSVPQYLTALQAGLAAQGWDAARNLMIDYHWEADSADAAAAAVLSIDPRPDALLTVGPLATLAAARLTPEIPIIFALVPDPVGLGVVDSLSHPGKNLTGFTQIDPSVAGKWINLIREIAPTTQVVGIMQQSSSTAPTMSPSMVELAGAGGLRPIVYPVATKADISAAISALAAMPDSALIGGADPFVVANRAVVLAEVTRTRLLSVFGHILFATDGAITYSIDSFDVVQRAAGYAGMVLNGTRPGDLPVQNPTKFLLTVNERAAKAVGLTVPASLLDRADQVIQ